MNNFIKDSLMKDIGWKILSVAIAIGLWFTVINIENPVVTSSVTVPIVFKNEEKLREEGLLFKNKGDFQNAHVTLRMRGQRISLDRITQKKSKIDASVDLAKILEMEVTEDKMQLPVDINMTALPGENYEIVSRDPQHVYVEIDHLVTAKKDVTVRLDGTPAPGSIVSSPVVTPSALTVSGAQTDVARVAEVRVVVSVNNLNKDSEIIGVPAAYDANDNLVEDVSLSAVQVLVTVGVSQNKTVPFVVNTIGTPIDTYEVQEVSISPESVTVNGKAAALQKLSKIELPPVSVAGERETVRVHYSLDAVLPDGITAVSGTSQNITVTVTIQSDADMTIFIPKNKITLTGSQEEIGQASILSDGTSVILRGDREALRRQEEAGISASASVAGLSAGTYQIPLSLNLSQNVEVAGMAPTIGVEIKEKPEEAETPPAPDTVPPEEDANVNGGDTPAEDTPDTNDGEGEVPAGEQENTPAMQNPTKPIENGETGAETETPPENGAEE